jgi:hypothetical protein
MPLPRLRDDVQIHKTGDGTFAVRDGQGRDVVHLTSPGVWLLVRLDGVGDESALLDDYAAAFSEDFPADELRGWIEDLDGAGLLVRDHRANDVLSALHAHGFRHRRPAPDRRDADREGGRREDDNRTAWFDRALFFLNEGDVASGLEIVEAFVADEPADVRMAELAAVLRSLDSGGDDRRDWSWRTFDAVLEGLLRAGSCPRCAAPFEVRAGTNRCESCGASFTSWLLEHDREQRREP